VNVYVLSPPPHTRRILYVPILYYKVYRNEKPLDYFFLSLLGEKLIERIRREDIFFSTYIIIIKTKKIRSDLTKTRK